MIAKQKVHVSSATVKCCLLLDVPEHGDIPRFSGQYRSGGVRGKRILIRMLDVCTAYESDQVVALQPSVLTGSETHITEKYHNSSLLARNAVEIT